MAGGYWWRFDRAGLCPILDYPPLPPPSNLSNKPPLQIWGRQLFLPFHPPSPFVVLFLPLLTGAFYNISICQNGDSWIVSSNCTIIICRFIIHRIYCLIFSNNYNIYTCYKVIVTISKLVVMSCHSCHGERMYPAPPIPSIYFRTDYVNLNRNRV